MTATGPACTRARFQCRQAMATEQVTLAAALKFPPRSRAWASPEGTAAARYTGMIQAAATPVRARRTRSRSVLLKT